MSFTGLSLVLLFIGEQRKSDLRSICFWQKYLSNMQVRIVCRSRSGQILPSSLPGAGTIDPNPPWPPHATKMRRCAGTSSMNPIQKDARNSAFAPMLLQNMTTNQRTITFCLFKSAKGSAWNVSIHCFDSCSSLASALMITIHYMLISFQMCSALHYLSVRTWLWFQTTPCKDGAEGSCLNATTAIVYPITLIGTYGPVKRMEHGLEGPQFASVSTKLLSWTL